MDPTNLTRSGTGTSDATEMTEGLFCSWHESLIVEPWQQLPGGVRVAQADDPEQPIILLRDQGEVEAFIGKLREAECSGTSDVERLTVEFVEAYRTWMTKWWGKRGSAEAFLERNRCNQAFDALDRVLNPDLPRPPSQAELNRVYADTREAQDG